MTKSVFKDCRGFTLLEMMIVIVLLGILATLAIPKFNNSIALANTAKIQSDLQTLNTAIAMHIIQYGKNPTDLKKDLGNYIDNIDELSPPQGTCFLKTGEKLKITAKSYTLDSIGETALCQEHPLKDFGTGEK
ncbi:type II secretion system protein [Pectinatus frisingensis]|uniref:type II secretion system protein n=1 Tax=Pectinatus frisingensis TaxID=865 RepID=UPI0018C55907|nr:prepilin-type N-terminal cleavage/methylation domain-containing protein [Pectinatus frisingensis]